MKILLVDDSITVRAVYGDLLRQHGYDVLEAGSKSDALTMAFRAVPEIGIIDFFLPDGNGDALVRALLADSRTSNMMLTMFSIDSGMLQRALKAGAVDLISKNDPHELFLLRINMIRRLADYREEQLFARKQLTAFSNDLKRKHDELQAIVDALPYFFYVIDTQSYTITMANKAVQANIGQDTCHTLIHHSDVPCDSPEHRCPIVEVLRTKKPVTVEHIHKNSTGDSRLYSVHAIPMFDEADQVTRVIELAIDITEQRQLEDWQRYAAYQSGVGEMSISILHNIGNALQSIVMHSDTLHRESENLLIAVKNISKLKDSANKRVMRGDALERVFQSLLKAFTNGGQWLQEQIQQEIMAHIEEIRSSIQHVSDVIHIQQGATSQGESVIRFRTHELINHAVTVQEDTLQKYGITVETDVEDIWVTLPRNQLLQALLNLIKNGREAIVERSDAQGQDQGLGTITGCIRIEVRRVGDHTIEIVVRDNGTGIEQNQLKKIFSNGYTTKEHRTGYGLHATANFVQSQGGTIQAMSDGKDRGAQFIMQLPKDRSTD